MARMYCTGPAHLYAGVGPSNRGLYLGTTEGEPEIHISPEMEGVPNDLGGRKPFDYQFQGEEGFISGVLTRYNEVTLALIQARTYRATAARGFQAFGSIGAFMGLEGHGFTLWLTFPYVTKPAMAVGLMPAGYRFPVCFSESERMPVGTRARRVHVQFHAQRLFSTANGGSWLLYDHVVTGLPAID